MILDTNALSGAADGNPGGLEIIAGAEWVAAPVIVLAEYRLGIAQSRHRKEYEEWLREWVATVTVVDVDRETTHQYARIGLALKSLDCGLVPTAFVASSEPRPPFRCRGRTPEARMVRLPLVVAGFVQPSEIARFRLTDLPRPIYPFPCRHQEGRFHTYGFVLRERRRD